MSEPNLILHPRQQQSLALADMLALGEHFAKSGMFPDIRQASQAVVKIMVGAELGFGPMASLIDIHMIEGKPSVGAHLRAAKIQGDDRFDYDIVESTRKACELAFYERTLTTGGEIRKGLPGWVKKAQTIRMTFDEAVESGLAVSNTGKGVRMGDVWIKTNWFRTPDDMLFARCISKGYRRYCPALTNGVLAYDPDEMDRDNLVDLGAQPTQQQPLTLACNLPTTTVPQLPQKGAASVAEGSGSGTPEGKSEGIQTVQETTQETQLLTDDQAEQINTLTGKLELSVEKFVKRIKSLYDITEPMQLTTANADDLIAKLTDALAKKEKAEKKDAA